MYTTRYLNVIKHLVVNQLRHKEGLLVIPDEEAKLTSVGHLAHWSLNGQKSHVLERFGIVLLVVKLPVPDQMIL